MKSPRNQEEVLAVNRTPLPAALAEGSCGLRRRRMPHCRRLGKEAARLGGCLPRDVETGVGPRRSILEKEEGKGCASVRNGH
jgi:hypothetical protein